jgi:hypothetical protein
MILYDMLGSRYMASDEALFFRVQRKTKRNQRRNDPSGMAKQTLKSYNITSLICWRDFFFKCFFFVRKYIKKIFFISKFLLLIYDLKIFKNIFLIFFFFFYR